MPGMRAHLLLVSGAFLLFATCVQPFFANLRACMCMIISVCVSACVYVYMGVCKCMCACVYGCVLHVHMYGRVYVYMCMYMCMCMYVYVCACVWTCVRLACLDISQNQFGTNGVQVADAVDSVLHMQDVRVCASRPCTGTNLDQMIRMPATTHRTRLYFVQIQTFIALATHHAQKFPCTWYLRSTGWREESGRSEQYCQGICSLTRSPEMCADE